MCNFDTILEEDLEREFRQFIELPKHPTQKQLFEQIWEEKAHFSEISNSPLLYKGHYQWHWQFLHILGKGAYPMMKVFKPNIMLALPDEHNKQEQYDVFLEKQAILRRIYYKVIYNKKFD